MADHNFCVIVFTVFLLSCVYTRTAGTLVECEEETLKKEVTWSKTGIAHASFCLEVNPPPHHYAEILGEKDIYCFVHHLCAGRYYWWWEASDTDQDIYTIHVQIRDVRAQGGGEFPIIIFTDRYSDSLKLTVVVSEKGESQSNYVPFLPHVKQNVPECAAAEARPISKSGASCPNGWLPVGNGLCVMDEVGPPLNYLSATESCADFGATLVKLKKDNLEVRRRRQASNENDDEDEDNGDMEGDEDDYADEDDEEWDDETEEEDNVNDKDDNFEDEEGEEEPSDDVQREGNDEEDEYDDEYSDNDVDDEEDQEGETNEDDYEDEPNPDSDSPGSLKKQEEEQNYDSDSRQESDQEKDEEEKKGEDEDETLNDDRNEDDEQDDDYDDENENNKPREGEGEEEKSKEGDKDKKEEESVKDNEDKIQGGSNNKEDVKNISRDEDGDDSKAVNEDKDEESKGVDNTEDDKNVGKVEEDFKSLTLKDHYTLNTCLNARLMVLAGSQNLWVLNEDNELSCMSYNSVTGMLQEENSCKYLYNRYACLFDANKYKKPKITNFSVKFHFSKTNHKNVSLSVKSGGTIYHDVTEDVDSVTVSCEADGWPVPEVLILEDSGVGRSPAFHSSPHHQNISGGQDSLLGRFTCIAGNIFGDEVKINDLQLWRPRQMSRTKMIVSGVLVLLIFFLVVAMCIIVNRVRMCKNWAFCRFFVCPWNCCSFSRKRPAGSTRLANDIFPPSSDYVYGDVWADEVPLYVRQTRARKSPETGNIYRAIKEQEQEQQA
ncbi:midasin [Plakobranchus ocellatus]|uniref:Midasin n=1 Tax=Plakobranchus ocellatus TaxID=259542 RepID=A0AAV3YBR8_9GAST|nr:midasin [Plakobranchus ocellatus]